MPVFGLVVVHAVFVSSSAARSALLSSPLPGGKTLALVGVSPVEKPALPLEEPLPEWPDGVEEWCEPLCVVVPGDEPPPVPVPPMCGVTAGGEGVAACGATGAAGLTFGGLGPGVAFGGVVDAVGGGVAAGGAGAGGLGASPISWWVWPGFVSIVIPYAAEAATAMIPS